jgi:6-phosphogluconolactonase
VEAAGVTDAPFPELRVFPDREAMSLAAADLFTQLARDAAADRDRFSVALSGGSTPEQLYELLASPLYRDRVPWCAVHVFWADERCVPRDHPDSNFRLVSALLLSRVSLPAENVHRVPGEDEPGQAARRYEAGIRRFFGTSGMPVFDLVILGVGQDGHTASLFPGAAALGESKRLAVETAPGPAQKHARVTLTLPALNSAAYVLILASGEEKAGIIHEIIDRGNRSRYPAGLVRPARGSLQWFVDQAAAQKLSGYSSFS